jgi:DNA repair exonuclease SbcCD ATPase subunit
MENWLCYRGRHELTLPRGLVVVLAQYEGQPGRSNWAGKTALLEAPIYALWDWHRKRLAQDVVTWGETSCHVVVEMDDGTHVHRGRVADGPVSDCDVPGEGTFSGRDAAARLGKVLALEQEDAFTTVVFRQGDIEALTSATAAQRQAILASWLKQDGWERCEDRAREEARKADQMVTSARLRVELAKEEIDLEAAEAEVAELEKKVEGYHAKLSEVKDGERIADAKARFELLKERAAKYRAVLAKPEPSSDGTEQAMEKVVGALQSARQERDRIFRLRSSGFDGVCPVMDRPCPAKDAVADFLPGEAQLRAAETQVARGEKVYSGLKAARDNELSRVAERRDAESGLAAAIEEGKRLKTDASRELPDAGDTRQLVAEASAAGRRLVELKAKVEVTKQRRRDAEAAMSEMAKATVQADILWTAADCFGRNGIQGVEADTALAEVENRANEVLRGTGLAIKFATAREGKKLESACRRCSHTFRGQKDWTCPRCNTKREQARQQTLDILVTESGRDYLVDECSGGARAIVAASIRLGAAWLLRSLRGSPVSFLLVDEPFAALDTDNRKTLALRFGEMAAIAGFEQVIVVTHDRDLADSIPNRVVVTRGVNGDSHVEVE